MASRRLAGDETARVSLMDLCRRVDRDFAEHVERPGALAKMYAAARQAQADLNTMEAPAEDEQAFARYLKVNQQRIDLLAAALNAPANGVASDPKMKRAEALQARSSEIVRELGFEHCS
ncbi:hypothetical protein LRS13_18010 [Svornostia abyssi]|uniref:YlbF family regulator n=1 Tax=Svornostia abyssi TaxID=2898438 RepID=A0ABY5PDS0_9ACTN|nr:hypothetical protein LRS13_18010 [Parviterribacteraceae bacterium J379]